MKFLNKLLTLPAPLSPPARGAWIEIFFRQKQGTQLGGRPPHGGRGLKYSRQGIKDFIYAVAPRTGGVD